MQHPVEKIIFDFFESNSQDIWLYTALFMDYDDARDC